MSVCPVCGFDGLPEDPRDEICHSCGIQFGYDDAWEDDLRQEIYRRWRAAWEAGGRKRLGNEESKLIHRDLR